MTTPREIIADILEDEFGAAADQRSDDVLSALTAAGIHLMTDADLAKRDDAVLERAAALADDRANGREQLFLENGASINAAKSVEADEIASAIRALKGGKP